MAKNIISGMLRGGLYTRVVGRRLVYFQRLSSTMDEAARRAKEGVQEGTVFLAEEQTAGRGRFRRTWVSPRGNLYLSIVLRPSIQVMQYLSIISGVALVRAIRRATALNPVIKWPNDVRIRGKKVAGILVENALQDNIMQYAVVGIGVNVSLDPNTTDELSNIATSLNVEAGKVVDREVLLRHLLQEMDRLYVSLGRASSSSEPGSTSEPECRDLPSLPASLDAIRNEWRGLLETLGKHVEARWQDDVYIGYAEDVDKVGNLLLRLEDGTLATLPAGEVTSGEKVEESH